MLIIELIQLQYLIVLIFQDWLNFQQALNNAIDVQTIPW